jgi:hypothetical protein
VARYWTGPTLAAVLAEDRMLLYALRGSIMTERLALALVALVFTTALSR